MKMPVTEFKEENLPKELKKKKIKEIKYRRKYGKMATIPVVTLFLIASLTLASGSYVVCKRHTVTFGHSGPGDILVNGTDGVVTDVWVLNLGNESLHYNWDGSTNSASDFNFTTGNEVDGLNGFCWNRTKTSMYFVTGWDEVYEYDKDGVNVKNHSASGISDSLTGCTCNGSFFWTTHEGGNMTKWDENWTLIESYNISALVQPMGITTTDGINFWIDDEYYGSQTLHVNASGQTLAQYNLSQTGDHPMSTGISTTDGEHFWYIDYDTGAIVRTANDSTPPQIRNAGKNLTYMTRNGTLGIWGQVYDSCMCNWTWIRSNETGTFIDITGSAGNRSVPYNNEAYNLTFNWTNNTHYCGQKLGLYICVNDTAGNSNCSDVINVYRLPYANSTTGAALGAATCVSEYDATWVFTATGITNHMFIIQKIYRNATHSECNFETIPGGRMEIRNTTIDGVAICTINVSGDSVSSGDSIRLFEAEELRGASPSNLPTALAGLVATLIIFVYSYTTKRT